MTCKPARRRDADATARSPSLLLMSSSVGSGAPMLNDAYTACCISTWCWEACCGCKDRCGLNRGGTMMTLALSHSFASATA